MMTALFERINLQARQYPQREAVHRTGNTQLCGATAAGRIIECQFQAA